MEERRLGPVVGLGTWNTFDGDLRLARGVVTEALDAGCRVFDTSPMYGAAEETLGAVLDDRRAQAAIATKIWASGVEEGRRQFADQLRRFGRVEIEQIHNLVAWQEHVPWLQQERDAGKIDCLGVTHWQASAFDELLEPFAPDRSPRCSCRTTRTSASASGSCCRSPWSSASP